MLLEPPFGRCLHAFWPIRQLVFLLNLKGRIGTQPQRGVRRLHSLRHHTRYVVAQGVQIHLFSRLGWEGFQRLPRVVLLATEAPSKLRQELRKAKEYLRQGR
jgi:hypothetical protein